MDDGETMELAPLSAKWWAGLGVSECCGAMLEVLQAPDGSVIISRCGLCDRGVFADELEDLAS